MNEPNAPPEEEDELQSSEPPVLVKGDKCGEYVIDELIAGGGMAQIFRAHSPVMARVVAIKTPLPRYRKGPEAQQRMAGEARALAEIDHPNVVRIHTAGHDPVVGLYIVMELLEGKNLRQIMRWSGGLKLPEALGYAIEIANATHELHKLGIFHRDIKPENIFITKSRVLKLLDLGAAKVPKYGARTTGNFKTVGTVAYMSPEHLNAGKITAASDVYSLGHMAYEMIAKKHAFMIHHSTVTPQEFHRWQLAATPELLDKVVDGVSPETARVIAKALEKVPEKRYPDMAAFGNALRGALDRELEARRAPSPSAAAVAAATSHAGKGAPAPDASAQPSDVKPKGKFGTDVMVPQVRAADLRRSPAPTAAAARPHVTPRTIRMGIAQEPPVDPRASSPDASPRPVAAISVATPADVSRKSFQQTPSPLTLDDARPRSGLKLAVAVLSGLGFAILVVVGVQMRRHSAEPTPAAAVSTAANVAAPPPATPASSDVAVGAEPTTSAAPTSSPAPTDSASSGPPSPTSPGVRPTTGRAPQPHPAKTPGAPPPSAPRSGGPIFE